MVTSLRSWKPVKYLQGLLVTFTPSERLLLYVLIIVLSVSTCTLVALASDAVMVTVPTHGGTIIEGEVGPLRFINPVLALSDADQDASSLVYAGLMQAMPDGSLRPRLASSYTVSGDGLTYTFTLRPDVYFHDGTRVTASDIAYTISLIQDPAIKSPRAGDWTGITVSAPDERTVVFTLSQPYASFLRNTTLGIVPKHIWSKYSSEEVLFAAENINAIGAGSFQVSHVSKDQTGSVTSIDFSAYSGSVGGKPYLDTITFDIFPDANHADAALKVGTINALADSIQGPLTGEDVTRVPLPRVFGVFFNQNHNAALADPAVRQALIAAVDVPTLVKTTLNEDGVALTSPIPPNTFATIAQSTRKPLSPKSGTSTPVAANSATIAAAQAILLHAGWKQDPSTGSWSKNKTILNMDIATVDNSQLVPVANSIAVAWKAVGVTTSVSVYSISDLTTKVIKPRDYDSILFGEAVGPQLDLYAFWFSKERNDPGLNLSMYANSTVDTTLLSARSATSSATEAAFDQKAAQLITADSPALILYSPVFSYILPTTLQGVTLGALSTPADRFQNVSDWYMQTERVWGIFARYVR